MSEETKKINTNLWWFVITLAIIGIDRITKTLIVQNLPFEQALPVMPFLNLFFTFNAGAAFSFLGKAGGWQEWLFGSIAVFISIFLIIWQLKIFSGHRWLKIALALILGGTLGNLYDRIIYHRVIDFLDFYYKQWHYATFNLADTAICVGAIMLVVDIVCKGEILHS
jgi:signal peptidase II